MGVAVGGAVRWEGKARLLVSDDFRITRPMNSDGGACCKGCSALSSELLRDSRSLWTA